MEPIKRNDTGAAVEDVQTRLARIGHLPEDAITGIFDDATAAALAEFLAASALPPSEEVTEKVWAALVDATYNLGDRTLYLRMPYFHGHDVLRAAAGAGGARVLLRRRRRHLRRPHRRRPAPLPAELWGCPPTASPVPTPTRRCATWPTPGWGRRPPTARRGIWASPGRPTCWSATPCACSAPTSSPGPWPRACRTWLGGHESGGEDHQRRQRCRCRRTRP